MAISQMEKFLLVSHRSESSDVLESLQVAGICQILNGEESIVSKDRPELAEASERPRDIESRVGRLVASISFLKEYTSDSFGSSLFSPLVEIDEQSYRSAVSDESLFDVVDKSLEASEKIEKLGGQIENIESAISMLRPWAGLETPVEQIGELEQAVCVTGIVGNQYFEDMSEGLGELGSAVESVSVFNGKNACLVAGLKEGFPDVLKLLRAFDFEPVNFESMKGRVSDLIDQNKAKLAGCHKDLAEQVEKAGELAKNLLNLEIVSDYYKNLLDREQTRSVSPSTDETVIFEGWVRKRDYKRLEKIVSGFGASSLNRVEPGDGEEIPVEIDNNRAVRPFESITRLYGMPSPVDVDPTVFLAPFFAIFFGLCLTDAGYGFVMIGIFWFLLKKMQGDKKLVWMLMACSVATVFAGAVTGGWFGDAIQSFVPGMEGFRQKVMLFDPFEKPMVFFGLSLALGYFQIIFGIMVGFVHNLIRKNYIAAICDQLSWLVMLNSLVLFGLGKGGVISGGLGSFCGWLAILPAIAIVLFSEREGGWGGRLGMGAYQLFSTVFYVGDVLSYVRLMALGMVTAGFGMAVNVITKLVMDIPYVGIIFGALIFVGGHLFNIGMSALSSFVHSLRLQFVEFFPKFLVGGGKQFEPLSKRYEHVFLREKN